MRGVAGGRFAPRETIVRVNALATPWGQSDLVAAAGAGADAVLIPKVESADAVRRRSRCCRLIKACSR